MRSRYVSGNNGDKGRPNRGEVVEIPDSRLQLHLGGPGVSPPIERMVLDGLVAVYTPGLVAKLYERGELILSEAHNSGSKFIAPI